MSYGATAQRVPARAVGSVEDVDLYKIGMLINAERGVVTASGIIDKIYSSGEFEKMLGGLLASYYGGYVARSFFNTLKRDVRVEAKVINYIATDSVQASSQPLNSSNPCMTIKAGMKGNIDKSSFGNKTAYKIEKTEGYSYTLSANIGIAGTSAVLTSVEGLEVGHHIRLDDGVVDETKAIVTIDRVAKTVTFTALANAAPMTVANTEIFRQDYTYKIAVKDINGLWEQKEKYDNVPWESNLQTLIQVLESKSYYIVAEVVAYVEVDAASLPVDVTAWTALTGGLDGTGPTASDYNTLGSLFDDSDISILIAPELSTATHNANMIAHSNNGYKYMYYVNVPNGLDAVGFMDFGGSLKETYAYAMIPMDKWFETDDPLNPAVKKQIPNVGYLAAHYFNMYKAYGIKKVAAGNKDAINTADKPIENNIRHNDEGGIGDLLIRNYSVNIGKWQSGKGTLVNSARTLSNDGGYRYQNQIMGYLLIKRAILNYLETIEQDPSGSAAQEMHRNIVWAYMKRKYDDGVFYVGQKEDGSTTDMDDVVTIINDFSINSLVNIANGIEEMFVEVKFVPPIEEPILSLASAPVTTI